MKRLVNPGLRGIAAVVHSPHFWAIFFIVLTLTFIYYSHIYLIDFSDPRWNLLWNLVVFEIKNDFQGSLFCIPFIYAAIVFWWRGILITWIFSIALMMPRIRYLSPDISSFTVNMVFFLIPLLVVLILALQRRWRWAERKASAEREEERQAFVSQIIEAQENERKRISREIHDDTTQRLWIIANCVQNLVADRIHIIDHQMATELETIKDKILSISDDAKRLSLALRPGILDDLGLVPAIRWQIDQLGRESSIEAKILVEGPLHPLTHEINTHLFRIAQEALSNVRRHSEATKVAVALEFNTETVKMAIHDNGKGFSVRDANKLSKHNKLGIIGIQERTKLLGGTLKINSGRGKGTTILLEFKLPSVPQVC